MIPIQVVKTTTTEMPKNVQILIRTPVAGDTGALARIHLTAFKKDRLVRLMYSEANHWKAVDAMIERRSSQVDCEMKMAMAKTVDRIAGWLCCSLVDSNIPGQDGLASLEWTTAALRVVDDAEERLRKSSGRPDEVAERDRRRSMWKAISDASSEAFSKSPYIVRETRYIVVNTVVTDIAFQGRGVGSELLSWATNYADNEGIAIRAQVSPLACGLFSKAGFEEVHSLVLDLDGFYYGGVAKEYRGKSKWGNHEIKFMVRKARTRSEIDRPSQQLQPQLP